MKFTKVSTNLYKAENGYTIRKTIGNRVSSKAVQWWVYNEKNEYVTVTSTLKFAKEVVESR